MPKPRGLPDNLRMRHDAHYVETLAASAGAPVGRHGADRPDRPQPRPAAPGHGRPGRADFVGHREGHHRAAGRPPARAALPDHRRRAALPRLGSGRPDRAAGGDSRRRRPRNAGARAGREHPAQGPDAVRRSRRHAGAGAALRLHPRGPGQAAGEVAHLDYRGAVDQRHPGGGPQGLPAGRALRTGRCCCRSSAKATRRRCWPWSKRLPARARPAISSARTKKRRSRKPGGPKSFVFAFRPTSKAFNLRLSFNKKNASKDEVIAALENILHELKRGEVIAELKFRATEHRARVRLTGISQSRDILC